MRPVSWSSSYLLRDPLGISTTTWTGCSVPDEAEELIALDQLPALEELELDQGGDADDLAAQALHQAGRGPGGAAGGEHVVDDQDPLAGHHGVGVQLQGGRAVLERVLLGLDLVGQLAGLADGDEAGPEVVGDRRGQDEPAGLDTDHLVDVAAAEVDDRLVDHRREADLVGQQRGDVLEDDPRLGEVGHVADEGPQALDVDGHGGGPPVGASAGGAWPGGTAGARTACGAAGSGVASEAGGGPAPGRPRPTRSRRPPPAPPRRGRPARARVRAGASGRAGGGPRGPGPGRRFAWPSRRRPGPGARGARRPGPGWPGARPGPGAERSGAPSPSTWRPAAGR